MKQARRRVWPVVVLLLALALRLTWVRDPGFTPDVSFFTRWMRLAAENGIGQVFATAESSYPPISVYLLGLLGLVSSPGALDAPPAPAELLMLRAAIIFSDMLMITLLYRLGQRIAGRAAAEWAALLYALCPGGIYLSGWWVQIDAWFVLPMVLGAWWLARERVALAWAALGLAMTLKLQAVVLIPIFAIGTWRWWGARRLVIGSVVLVLTLSMIVTPLLLSGQVAELLPKMTYAAHYFQWITLESHNLWFALTPRARDLGEDVNRDLNAFVAGVSFRDAGLALLALGYGLILARLFVRSRPRAIFAACAVAWLMFFMLPTRIDARYLYPALPLMLCAGFYRRRWWALYAVAAMTLLINLVWKSRGISPLMGVLPITLGGAVFSSWVNVAILGAALAFYAAPLLAPAERSVMKRGWEKVLLSIAVIVLLSVLGAMLWRGRAAGAQIAELGPPLRASLNTNLDEADVSGPIVVVNWPRTVSANRSVYLGGIIPVTPPALFLESPETINREATWVQYQPWQQVQGLELEYHGAYATQAELTTLAQQARLVVAFSPPLRQMVTLAQTWPIVAPSTCIASFDERACLVAARAAWRDSALKIELTWQATDTLPTDETVFVHIIDARGNLAAQADGDPAGGLVSLASLSNLNGALRETRLVAISPGNYWVRIGVYNRASGERIEAHCRSPHTCVDNAIEIVTR